MDVNDLRIVVTLSSLVLFVALMAHTWSRRRKADYEEAARLPFLEDAVGSAAPVNKARSEGETA
jgi:cytochrome c oxidase cbb3-type subunit IV